MTSNDNKSANSSFLSTDVTQQASNNKQIVIFREFRVQLEERSPYTTIDSNHFSSTHEESDARIFFHVIYSHFKFIVVSSKDIDVLVLLVLHFKNISLQSFE